MTTAIAESKKANSFLRSLIEASCIDGKCYDFAIAFSRALDWPMVGLMLGNEIRHAGVRDPQNCFWDARGVVEEEKIGEPFGIKPPYNFKRITEEDLFAVRPIHQIELDFLLRKIQVVWPDLPWKEKPLAKKVVMFVDELEELCRKHNFWIYGVFPASPPVITEGIGDERGYEIKMDATGGNYFLKRIIG